MSRFLKNTFLFGLIFLCYALSMYFINKKRIQNNPYKIDDHYKMVMGDSHTQKGIDPEILGNAINFSQSAEPYILSYWKLKKFLETNKIDTVLLGFSPHCISGFNDKKFLSAAWSTELFRRSHQIGDYSKLNIPIDKTELNRIKLKNMALFPISALHPWVGQYKPGNKNNLSYYDKTLGRHYTFDEEPVGTSVSSIAYIDSIVVVCKSQGITFMLLETPLHNLYYDNIPELNKTAFLSEKKRFQQMNIPVLEFMNHPYEDKYFHDVDHLNQLGAEQFSRDIKQKLKGMRK